MKYFKSRSTIEKITDVVGLIFMLAGVITSFRMNLAGRSFWIDEAMLSYSFSKRGLANLISAPFEMMQSAPALYLYICKITTIIFGNTEFVLRMVSVVSFALVLLLATLLAKNLLNMRFFMLPGAMLANFNLFLIQSNNFKQYVFETALLLMVLYAYTLIGDKSSVCLAGKAGKKIDKNDLIMGLVFMICIWGANPVAFLTGGILTYEFLRGIIERNKARIIRSICWGIGTGISFVAYYLIWLRVVATGDGMQEYWQGQAFPIIPRSVADIKDIIAFIYEIFIEFREGRVIMTGLVATGLIVGCIYIKNRFYYIAGLCIIIALVASSIHMFPIANRLWCFAYPLFVLLGFGCLDWVVDPEKSGSAYTGAKAAIAIVMLTLILCCNGISVYRNPMNCYMAGEELNIPLKYVQDNIADDESVYVFTGSVAGVRYKIGYDTNWIGGDDTAVEGRAGNIIWSEGNASKEEYLYQDVEAIKAAKKCYILASHTTAERFDPLLEALEKEGELSVVMSEYATPLYYFECN